MVMILAKVIGAIGLILIIIGVWVKKEKKQDWFFIFGSLGLLTYSIQIKDPIFIPLQIIFLISSSYELYKLNKK